MDRFTEKHLQNLVDRESETQVSIYMPTVKEGSKQLEQNPIRLKNLVKEARKKMKSGGIRSGIAKKVLQSAEDLIDDNEFWRSDRGDGLALFLDQGFFEHYRLPVDFDELTAVGSSFHLKPLLPLLMENGKFYVLAFSQNQVRLLECTRFGSTDVDLGDIPQSLEDIIPEGESFEEAPQIHTATSAKRGGRVESKSHGHGVGDDERMKKFIEKFARKVDRGISNLIEDNKTPLVLAGVEAVLSIYRNVSDYPSLVGDSVAGNPEEKSDAELQESAWSIIRPQFQKQVDNSKERFKTLEGRNQNEIISNDLRKIVKKGFMGKIETLFVALEAHQWGSYDPENNQVEFDNEDQVGNLDLLDFATLHTLKHNGSVYALPLGEMPVNGSVAAIFRK